MLCGTGEFNNKNFERHCDTQKHRNAVALAKEEKFGCDICGTGPLTKKDYNRHCETTKHKDAEFIFKQRQSKDACEMPDSKRHKEKDVESGKSDGDSPDGEQSQLISNSKRLRGNHSSHDESDGAINGAEEGMNDVRGAAHVADAGSINLANDSAINEGSSKDGEDGYKDESDIDDIDTEDEGTQDEDGSNDESGGIEWRGAKKGNAGNIKARGAAPLGNSNAQKPNAAKMKQANIDHRKAVEIIKEMKRMDQHGHQKASVRLFQKALPLLDEDSKNGLCVNSRAFLFEFAPESLNDYAISYRTYYKAHLLGCTLAQTNLASISLMVYLGIHCGCTFTSRLIKSLVTRLSDGEAIEGLSTGPLPPWIVDHLAEMSSEKFYVHRDLRLQVKRVQSLYWLSLFITNDLEKLHLRLDEYTSKCYNKGSDSEFVSFNMTSFEFFYEIGFVYKLLGYTAFSSFMFEKTLKCPLIKKLFEM
jgi:hypothetical protein